MVVEAAWAYRHKPAVGSTLRRRQAKVSPEVVEISWKAQHRLHQRYCRLMGKGKHQGEVVTAVARELLVQLRLLHSTIQVKLSQFDHGRGRFGTASSQLRRR